MRRHGLPALLLTLALAPAAHAQPVEPLGHSGRWITDARGRVVVMHGVAIVPVGAEETPESAGLTSQDAGLLRDSGFNVVRLGFFGGSFEKEPGVFDPALLDSLARSQRVLSEAGLFSVIDLHQDMLTPRYEGRGFADWFALDDGVPNEPKVGFPGNYFSNGALNRAYDNLWANAAAADGVGLQDHLAELWRRTAARFSGARRLLGYDIFNEPWPGSEWPSCANTEGCPPGGFDQTELTAFSNKMIAAIRGADRTHVVFYEPNLQFDVGAKTGHGKVDDPNAGMSFHNYCLGAAPGLPRAPDPTNLCREVGERGVFENAEAHSARTGAPLLLTEFGDTEDPAIHSRVADLADEYMVSWTDWAYFRSTGQIKIDPKKLPEPDNLRTERLAAVVRAYPRLVAGTPLRFRYHADRERLDLELSTTTPGGRPAGLLESEVFVPPLHFGATYRVSIEGGELTGGVRSPLLTFRACRGADRITVTVTDERQRAPLLCVERGGSEMAGPAAPPVPTGRRVRCPRGNSRTVRCARARLGDRTRVLTIVGTRRSERLVGTRGRDVIVCGAGNDHVRALVAFDIVRCGPGRDVIDPGNGWDRVFSGPGDDVIRARDRDRDTLNCGSGHDRVSGADRGDRVDRSCG